MEPVCVGEHYLAGVSAVQADGHRHDRCSRCGFIGDACYTLSCSECRTFTCKIASPANLQAMKRAMSRIKPGGRLQPDE